MNQYRVMVYLHHGQYFGVQINAKDRPAAEIEAALLFPEACEVHAAELLKGVESIDVAYHLRSLRNANILPRAPA